MSQPVSGLEVQESLTENQVFGTKGDPVKSSGKISFKTLRCESSVPVKCWPADSSLLENSSEYDISIVLDPIIKSPVVEGQVNLLGLEKVLPLARVGLSYKESSYNNPGDHIMEDTLYKDSTKILTMKNWEDPVQGEWRRQGEETPHSILIAKNKHLVFDGASVPVKVDSVSKMMFITPPR